MWFNESQMSGSHLHENRFCHQETRLLFIFGNAFIIEKTVSDNGYNQIVGTELYGDFLDGALTNSIK